MEKKEKKGFVKEFKEFIARGNVLDMAVGVVMGSAFTAIVNSLVNDMIMPLVGIVIGGINFSDLAITLPAAAEGAEPVKFAYGSFIMAVVNFLIIAIVVFSVVKAVNKFHKKKEEEPAPAEEPKPSNEEVLLTEIRDLLKEK